MGPRAAWRRPFGGLGVARYLLGSTAMRRRRLEAGTCSSRWWRRRSAVRRSLRRRSPTSTRCATRRRIASRFGPTQSDAEPPHCTDALATGPTAVVALDHRGRRRRPADRQRRPARRTRRRRRELVGRRRDRGPHGPVRARPAATAPRGSGRHASSGGASADRPRRRSRQASRSRPPRRRCRQPGRNAGADPTQAPGPPGARSGGPGHGAHAGYRAAAEDRGLEFVEGARARHCRIALDGRTFQAAFPAATLDVRPRRICTAGAARSTTGSSSTARSGRSWPTSTARR